MLVIQTVSNGRTIVVFKRDWSPNRIGKAYRPNKNYVDTSAMERVQTALLRKQSTPANT